MTLDEAILRETRELRARLLDLQHEADRAKLEFHHAIRRLHAAGGSMREIAEALEVSHQRIHQIVEGDEPVGHRMGWTPPRGRRRRGGRRFTRVARHVVLHAQKEAHQLGAAEIGPEHLALGLAAVERGTAAQALAAQGVDHERIRSELGGVVRQPGRGRLPFTREAKHVLEAAVDQALERKQSWVGSEHVLLALLAAGGRPVEILERLGAAPDALRADLERRLAEAA
ncbi:MAG TPA: Clp protease N-terminal domain-containing protein [Gaiellaceae bacterium]|nr:Clp protease N-terminal domain-containing protein [Gaiellaceae bacterium]